MKINAPPAGDTAGGADGALPAGEHGPHSQKDIEGHANRKKSMLDFALDWALRGYPRVSVAPGHKETRVARLDRKRDGRS